MVSLASSVHAGPQTFALLVGSGISANAGVPSGWNLMIDLVRRLAAAHGEDPEPDPISWYRQRFDSEPDYSGVLAELAPSPGDRRSLLATYFEPTPDEREEGRKLPTRAHRAIAALVANGFVKVIVTTNFDRLLEAALTDERINPTIVSSPEHASGAVPIAHSRCTIIKVHGDYLSTELRNTAEELAAYHPSVETLLDEVFDQYGLIVCGWSGIWDTALRKAILRAPSRRFATYWMHRGPVAPEAEEIIANRDAIRVQISDADSALGDLVEKVQALSEATDQRPADSAVAVAQLKRYLPDPVHHIRLHDHLIGEISTAIEQTEDLPMNGQITAQQYGERMISYERAMSTALKLLATGAFFSSRVDHDQLWVRCIDRLATRTQTSPGRTVLVNIRQYPTLLALYALGFGAMTANRVDSIARVLAEVTVPGHPPLPVGVAASSWQVLHHDLVNQAFHSSQQRKTPISDRLWEVLSPTMSTFVGDTERLADLFDEVEYLMGIAYAAHRPGRGPVGRALWRSLDFEPYPGTLVKRHAQALVDADAFDSHEHLDRTCGAYDRHLHAAPRF